MGRTGDDKRSNHVHKSAPVSAPETTVALAAQTHLTHLMAGLLVDRQPSGAYLFLDSPPVFDGIQSLRSHIIDRLDLRICQPQQEGYQHA